MLPLNSSLACSPHILANVEEMPSTKIVENVMQFLIVLLFNSNKTVLKYDNEPDSWHGGIWRENQVQDWHFMPAMPRIWSYRDF